MKDRMFKRTGFGILRVEKNISIDIYKTCLLLSLFFCIQIICNDKVDIVVYSFDRPMQLYALLESMEKNIKNHGEVNILYRTRYTIFDSAYEQVKKRFKQYNFVKQGPNPHHDFPILVFKYAFETPNEYIMFAVDDIIVKDKTDLNQCVLALKKTNAYGFYLRLGKNITYCYMMGIKTPVPQHEKVNEDIFIFNFKDGKGDWAYPSCNDMAIYKKSDIKNYFLQIPLRNTSYEGYWHDITDLNKQGLFFEQSKIVNVPLNLTNEESQTNKNMKLYTPLELLNRFNNGYKFNIEQFHQINNCSPHMEYVPELIRR